MLKKERDRLYYLTNQDKIKQQRRTRYWLDPEKARADSAEYRLNHKDQYDKYRKEWRALNPEKVKAQSERAKLRYPEKHQLGIDRLKNLRKKPGVARILCARRRASRALPIAQITFSPSGRLW